MPKIPSRGTRRKLLLSESTSLQAQSPCNQKWQLVNHPLVSSSCSKRPRWGTPSAEQEHQQMIHQSLIHHQSPQFRSQNPHAEDAKRRKESKGQHGDRQALLGRTLEQLACKGQARMQTKNKWLAHANAKAHALWNAKNEEDAKTLLLQLVRNA